MTEEQEVVLQAARKLAECKGRYHTELNFKALVEALKRLDEESKC
jgi:hypothetical protein